MATRRSMLLGVALTATLVVPGSAIASAEPPAPPAAATLKAAVTPQAGCA